MDGRDKWKEGRKVEWKEWKEGMKGGWMDRRRRWWPLAAWDVCHVSRRQAGKGRGRRLPGAVAALVVDGRLQVRVGWVDGCAARRMWRSLEVWVLLVSGGREAPGWSAGRMAGGFGVEGITRLHGMAGLVAMEESLVGLPGPGRC